MHFTAMAPAEVAGLPQQTVLRDTMRIEQELVNMIIVQCPQQQKMLTAELLLWRTGYLTNVLTPIYFAE